MTTPAIAAPAAPAPVATDAPTAQDVAPKSPKEIAREAFKKETAELVERSAKERDQSGRFQKKDDSKPEADRSESKPQVEKKIWKLKVDGADVDFDATDEEAVRKAVQKAHAADKRMNEAAMTRKQSENFIELLRTNPRAVLEHPDLGIDLKELAERIVWEGLEKSSKSPEDLEYEQERRELEEYRKEKSERAAAEKQAHKEEMKEKYRQDWSQKFEAALDSGGIPRTDWALDRMAGYMRRALAKGHKHIQPADTVEWVRQDWIAAQKQMYGKLDGEKLIETLGADVVEKIRKTELKKFQDGGSRPAAKEAQKDASTVKYGSVEEMLRAQSRR